MRLSWRLCSSSVGLAPQRKAVSLRAVRPALQNAPVTRVQKIVIRATAKHPALQGKLAESFADLYLREDVVSALRNIGVTQPTVTQMLAIPKILRGKNILCAAETGSGKTLAYLSPVVSHLRDEEERFGLVPRMRRPRALVLLPSRDLAAQVLSVAKSLCHTAKFRAVGLIGGVKRKFVRDALQMPVDVVIATPDSLLRYRREERILLTDLRHLVIDEADTLFDESFESAITSILKDVKIRSKKPPLPPAKAEDTQMTIVGATLSTRMLKKIELLIPNIKKVSTKSLHQILPHVKQTFHKLHQHEKSEMLLSIINSSPTDVYMVFCNTVPSCDWTAHYLRANGVELTKLHAGFSSMDRRNLLKEFASGSSRVLVCTDIASRGIDARQVTHVILFDFPNSLADYLHRVGRTGRVGSQDKCRASIFMTHRRDVRMAWKIKEAADKRDAIMNHKVSRQLQRLEQGHSAPHRDRHR